MNAAVAIELITKVGIPAAKYLYNLSKSGKDLTDEDFAELENLASYTSDKALAAAGIKIDNGKVVFL